MMKLIKTIACVMLFVSGAYVMGQEIPVGTKVMTDAGEYITITAPNTNLPANRATSLTTFYARNNGGSPGGAFYFDISVAGQGISITALDLNTEDPGAITLSVYILEGTSFGNQTNPSAWGSPVAMATGVSAGLNNPSSLTLDVPILLSANTDYGIALVMDLNHGHDYTNGTGSNQFFSNEDLSLTMGTATNEPFTGQIFNPRVWNGTIYYDITSEIPLSNWALGIGIMLILVFTVIRFRRFS